LVATGGERKKSAGNHAERDKKCPGKGKLGVTVKERKPTNKKKKRELTRGGNQRERGVSRRTGETAGHALGKKRKSWRGSLEKSPQAPSKGSPTAKKLETLKGEKGKAKGSSQVGRKNGALRGQGKGTSYQQGQNETSEKGKTTQFKRNGTRKSE